MGRTTTRRSHSSSAASPAARSTATRIADQPDRAAPRSRRRRGPRRASADRRARGCRSPRVPGRRRPCRPRVRAGARAPRPRSGSAYVACHCAAAASTASRSPRSPSRARAGPDRAACWLLLAAPLPVGIEEGRLAGEGVAPDPGLLVEQGRVSSRDAARAAGSSRSTRSGAVAVEGAPSRPRRPPGPARGRSADDAGDGQQPAQRPPVGPVRRRVPRSGPGPLTARDQEDRGDVVGALLGQAADPAEASSRSRWFAVPGRDRARSVALVTGSRSLGATMHSPAR